MGRGRVCAATLMHWNGEYVTARRSGVPATLPDYVTRLSASMLIAPP